MVIRHLIGLNAIKLSCSCDTGDSNSYPAGSESGVVTKRLTSWSESQVSLHSSFRTASVLHLGSWKEKYSIVCRGVGKVQVCLWRAKLRVLRSRSQIDNATCQGWHDHVEVTNIEDNTLYRVRQSLEVKKGDFLLVSDQSKTAKIWTKKRSETKTVKQNDANNISMRKVRFKETLIVFLSWRNKKKFFVSTEKTGSESKNAIKN